MPKPISSSASAPGQEPEQDDFAKKLEALTSRPLSGASRGSIGGVKPAVPKPLPPKPRTDVSEDKVGASEIQKLMEKSPAQMKQEAGPFSVNEAIARVGQTPGQSGEIISQEEKGDVKFTGKPSKPETPASKPEPDIKIS
jgi:hypothetical protein